MPKFLPFILGALLLVAGCDTSTIDPTVPRLQKAFDNCDKATSMDGIEVGDDGEAIIITNLTDYEGMGCILAELDTAESVVSNMDSTTAMMGRQSADDDGLTYEWSYHPDNGLNMTITD